MYLGEQIKDNGFIQQALLKSWYKHSAVLGVIENY